MFLVMLLAAASVVALGVYQHRRGRGVMGLADAQPAPSSLAEGQKAEAPVFTAPSPVSVSLFAEPSRFSKFERESVPAPPVFCEAPFTTTVTAAAAPV